MRLASVLLLSVCTAALAGGQPATVSGPVQGFTFDEPTRSLRAVIGFPGSSSFGPALAESLDAGSVAPHRNYALAFQNGKCVFVSALDSVKVQVASVPGVSLQPEGVAWSADGSLAVLYSRTAGWFQILTGFPNPPSAEPRRDATVLGGALTAIAADPQGRRISVGVSGAAGGVYWTASHQGFVPLLSMNKPIALAFSSDGATLYALDGEEQQVTSAGVLNSGTRKFSSGLTDPVAIQAVPRAGSSELLYVAGRNDRLLRVFDLATFRDVADISLAFQPTLVEPLGTSSFVVAPRSKAGTPLWLFAETPAPGAYFVPAIPPSSGGIVGVGGTE